MINKKRMSNVNLLKKNIERAKKGNWLIEGPPDLPGFGTRSGGKRRWRPFERAGLFGRAGHSPTGLAFRPTGKIRKTPSLKIVKPAPKKKPVRYQGRRHSIYKGDRRKYKEG
ncbi:MAG: hypothetical protein V1676_04880 [Candidatus Diapherotrites archaeon]